jgi:hypothetical protein
MTRTAPIDVAGTTDGRKRKKTKTMRVDRGTGRGLGHQRGTLGARSVNSKNNSNLVTMFRY